MKPPRALQQAVWTKCNNGQCVEVAVQEGLIWVRGSRDANDVLSFTREEWDSFLDGVKRGRFDR